MFEISFLNLKEKGGRNQTLFILESCYKEVEDQKYCQRNIWTPLTDVTKVIAYVLIVVYKGNCLKAILYVTLTCSAIEMLFSN